MAKKNGITISDALIPKDDYPYDVPNNWCWVKLGAISSIISKGTTPKGGKSAYVDEGIDFLRVENINDDGTICHDNMMHVTEETHTGFLKRSMLKENDVLVSIAGTLGKTAIVKKDDLPLNTNQAVAFVRLADNGEISRDFIRYAIDTPVIQNMLLAKTKVTAIPNLTLEIISDCLIPLPPLAEQKRIVEQIESLFVKLDEAKDKVLDVITSSQCRKDSLLHKAFEGVLTCRWRDKNNVVLENKYYSFDECIQKMQNGLAKRSGSKGKEFSVIRLANLSTDGFVTEDLRMILLDEKEQENYRLYADDVLMIRVNGSKDNVARQICVDSDTEWAFCDHIIRIKYDKAKVLPRFMVYFSKNQYYRNYIADNMVSSAGQNTISRKGMANLRVPKIALEEQEEIIKILDKLWKAEDEMQIKAEQVIEQIELMKKSILAKAFRGELGTNNPEEESSIALLKEMLEKN